MYIIVQLEFRPSGFQFPNRCSFVKHRSNICLQRPKKKYTMTSECANAIVRHSSWWFTAYIVKSAFRHTILFTWTTDIFPVALAKKQHPPSLVRQNRGGLDNHVNAAPKNPLLLEMLCAGGSHHFLGKYHLGLRLQIWTKLNKKFKYL